MTKVPVLQAHLLVCVPSALPLVLFTPSQHVLLPTAPGYKFRVPSSCSNRFRILDYSHSYVEESTARLWADIQTVAKHAYFNRATVSTRALHQVNMHYRLEKTCGTAVC